MDTPLAAVLEIAAPATAVASGDLIHEDGHTAYYKDGDQTQQDTGQTALEQLLDGHSAAQCKADHDDGRSNTGREGLLEPRGNITQDNAEDQGQDGADDRPDGDAGKTAELRAIMVTVGPTLSEVMATAPLTASSSYWDTMPE